MKQLNTILLALLLLKPIVMENQQDIYAIGKIQNVLRNHTHAQISQQLMIVQDQLTVTGINQENVQNFQHVLIMMNRIVVDVMDADLLQVPVLHLHVLQSLVKMNATVQRLKLKIVHGQLMANAKNYLKQQHAQTMVVLKTDAKVAAAVNMQQIHVPLKHVEIILVRTNVELLEPVQLKEHCVLGMDQSVLMQLTQVN